MKHFALFTLSILMLTVCLSPADAAQKKKKKNEVTGDAVAGTIVSIAQAEGSEAKIVTVRVQLKKKKTTERKFELAKNTKLETLVMAKKQFGLTTAAVADLKQGERVLVQPKEGKTDQADRITLLSVGKKKKPAAN